MSKLGTVALLLWIGICAGVGTALLIEAVVIAEATDQLRWCVQRR